MAQNPGNGRSGSRQQPAGAGWQPRYPSPAWRLGRKLCVTISRWLCPVKPDRTPPARPCRPRDGARVRWAGHCKGPRCVEVLLACRSAKRNESGAPVFIIAAENGRPEARLSPRSYRTSPGAGCDPIGSRNPPTPVNGGMAGRQKDSAEIMLSTSSCGFGADRYFFAASLAASTVLAVASRAASAA